jgi:hypothetical protein
VGEQGHHTRLVRYRRASQQAGASRPRSGAAGGVLLTRGASWRDIFFGYAEDERKDDPFSDTTPASGDDATDDAPISILGGLVQINPKLAHLLGLTARPF